ncbi:MAG: MFS transporter [Deltaproteobacteria bacterium]|nr:MFS transporter [Deltaproteobacteria bacterium]
MSLQLFCIIGVFWILKPLKKSIFVEYYDAHPLRFLDYTFTAAQSELLAKNINMIVAFVAMVLFVAVARAYRKSHLIAMMSGLMLTIAVALAFFATQSVSFVWAFYVFGDLFNMVMVGAFFAFLNDSVSKDQVKRLYGMIVFGGVLGGAFGATVTRGLLLHMSISKWLFVGSGITVVIALLAQIASRFSPSAVVHSEHSLAPPSPETPLPVSRLIRSKYIMAIALIVGSYEIVSSLVDFQFTSVVATTLDGADIGACFSTVYMIVNIVSLSVQLLLTGVVMTRLGVTRALLFLPALLLMGSGAFLIAPILAMGALLCVFDNGLNYSINQSARESLYVLLPSESRYRAKAFADIFIHRTAKAISVNATLLLSALLSYRWLALVAICFIVIWISAVLYAGNQFDNDESANTPWLRRKRKSKLLKKRRLFPIAPSGN